MRVRVHKAWQHCRAAEINLVYGSEIARARVTERHDPTFVSPQPGVTKRRLRDRDEPSDTVEGHRRG